MQRELNRLEASQRSVTNLAILLFSFAMLFLMIGPRQAGGVDLTGILVRTIAMMGSFGPVTALSNLSNNLNQTLASGERVLSILEETPQVEEVSGMEEAKKASIHDFILTLPKGYDTEVGELGDTLSGGEKQRIGIARAFLYDAPFILLDEPTSNLDSLNEGMILKALKEGWGDKTVLLVSHRKSTMNVADVAYRMDNGRLS